MFVPESDALEDLSSQLELRNYLLENIKKLKVNKISEKGTVLSALDSQEGIPFYDDGIAKESYVQIRIALFPYLDEAITIEVFDNFLNDVYVKYLTRMWIEDGKKTFGKFSCTSYFDFEQFNYFVFFPQIECVKNKPRVVFNHELLHVLSIVYRLENYDAFYKTQERTCDDFIPYVKALVPELRVVSERDVIYKFGVNRQISLTPKNNINGAKEIELFKKLNDFLKLEMLRFDEQGFTWLCDYVARKVNDKEGVEFLRENDLCGYTKTFLKLEEKGTNIEDLIKTTLGTGYTFEEFCVNLAKINCRGNKKPSIEDYLI